MVQERPAGAGAQGDGGPVSARSVPLPRGVRWGEPGADQRSKDAVGARVGHEAHVAPEPAAVSILHDASQAVVQGAQRRRLGVGVAHLEWKKGEGDESEVGERRRSDVTHIAHA